MKKLLIALTFVAILLTEKSALAIRADESESPTPTPTPKAKAAQSPAATQSPKPAATTPRPRGTPTYTRAPRPTPTPERTVDRNAATRRLGAAPRATPAPTSPPPVTRPAGTPIVIAPFQGKPMEVTAPSPTASASTQGVSTDKLGVPTGGGVKAGDSTSGTLNATATTGNQNLKVTSGRGGLFRPPSQPLDGKLLCPIIGPGAKLEKGCLAIDKELIKKATGAAKKLGPSSDGACESYGRIGGYGPAFSDPDGNCYVCPVLMHRTVHPVTSTDPNTPACTAGNDEGIVWQSAQYPDPGVAAFINPEIVEFALSDRAYVDAFLAKRANNDSRRKEALWQVMFNAPNDSAEFKALIFNAILVVAQRDLKGATRASDAVSIFQDYIKQRRSYLARDAIGMYSAYLDLNAYKQNQGTKNAMAAGGPAMFQGLAKAIISTPGSSLGATIGIPPDDYVSAAYAAAVPDSRGEDFIRALLDLSATPYEKPAIDTTSDDPEAWIGLGLNVTGAAAAMHDVLETNRVIRGIGFLTGKGGLGIGMGMGLVGTILDGVAAAMTLYAQMEAEKQYEQLAVEAGKPVSIAQILKSGTDEDKSGLVMWWALGTSPYKASNTAGQSQIRNPDVCATYPQQCAEIKQVVAKVHQPPTRPPRPTDDSTSR